MRNEGEKSSAQRLPELRLFSGEGQCSGEEAVLMSNRADNSVAK